MKRRALDLRELVRAPAQLVGNRLVERQEENPERTVGHRQPPRTLYDSRRLPAASHGTDTERPVLRVAGVVKNICLVLTPSHKFTSIIVHFLINILLCGEIVQKRGALFFLTGAHLTKSDAHRI